MLTLGNLLCGVLAIRATLLAEDYSLAFMLIVLAGVFDFFDGFTARMLNQSSAIGLELDSLADMVSFGAAPALIMCSLFADATKVFDNPVWVEYGYYAPLIIVAFSALRLAKFNLDTEQTTLFIGLPTPACALFCSSIGMLHAKGLVISGEVIVALSVAMALLLISPLRLFALKFKGFGWSGNALRYSFILAAAALFLWLQLDSVPLIILLYIALSGVTHLVEMWSNEG